MLVKFDEASTAMDRCRPEMSINRCLSVRLNIFAANEHWNTNWTRMKVAELSLQEGSQLARLKSTKKQSVLEAQNSRLLVDQTLFVEVARDSAP